MIAKAPGMALGASWSAFWGFGATSPLLLPAKPSAGACTGAAGWSGSERGPANTHAATSRVPLTVFRTSIASRAPALILILLDSMIQSRISLLTSMTYAVYYEEWGGVS